LKLKAAAGLLILTQNMMQKILQVSSQPQRGEIFVEKANYHYSPSSLGACGAERGGGWVNQFFLQIFRDAVA
jgi:hypothetical protein